MKGYRLTVEAEYDLDGILDQGIDDYGIEAAIRYYDNLQQRFAELVKHLTFIQPLTIFVWGIVNGLRCTLGLLPY